MNPNDPIDHTVQITENISEKQAGDTIVTRTFSEERQSVLAFVQTSSAENGRAETPFTHKYEILGELGRGGAGEVVCVLDRDLKREVAMKRLLAQSQGGATVASRDGLIRFIEEAQATGQLEHPNIVPVHDLGIDRDGRIYFTLKYVQGVSLKKVIRGRTENAAMEEGGMYYRERYSPLRMLEILIAMCQA